MLLFGFHSQNKTKKINFARSQISLVDYVLVEHRAWLKFTKNERSDLMFTSTSTDSLDKRLGQSGTL